MRSDSDVIDLYEQVWEFKKTQALVRNDKFI
jgi:hypothetical protein